MRRRIFQSHVPKQDCYRDLYLDKGGKSVENGRWSRDNQKITIFSQNIKYFGIGVQTLIIQYLHGGIRN